MVLDDDLDQSSLQPGAMHEVLDLAFAAVEGVFVAVLGKERESFEVAETVVYHPSYFAGVVAAFEELELAMSFAVPASAFAMDWPARDSPDRRRVNLPRIAAETPHSAFDLFDVSLEDRAPAVVRGD
jgi:hypothetical protein